MTQADRVLSTPPTNTSANNPSGAMTHDDKLGMAWWNALSKQERAEWSKKAGNTGRVKDAWEAFKRGSVDQTAPVDQARRRFLTVAAGASVASVGTLAVAAVPAAAPYGTACAADPIYAVIEQHKQATAAHDAAADVRGRFNDVHMDDEQKEQLAVLEDTVDDAWDRLDDAGGDLVNTKPTTLAGIVALCRYVEPFLNEGSINLPELLYWDDETQSSAAGAFANVIAAAVAVLIEAPAEAGVIGSR